MLPVSTVQNHFRTTVEVESVGPMEKDDLLDLSAFDVFGGLLMSWI